MIKTKDELSSMFKEFQNAIKKRNEYETGIISLISLRAAISDVYKYIFSTTVLNQYALMPLSKDKTIAYYIYHLLRIEDICAHTLIKGDEQIFYRNNYKNRLNSSISTTGNELRRDELCEFSKKICIDEIQKYSKEVLFSTNEVIKNTSYQESKQKISSEKKEKLIALQSVSSDENAFWLVDYWCKKTTAGLFLMPFSRHQMLHLQGCLRILKKLSK